MKMPTVEMSNPETIRFFTDAFINAAERGNFIPPLERWDNTDYALDVAGELAKFGKAIEHNSELYMSGFLNGVRRCFEKVAEEPKAVQVRQALLAIPGFTYAPSNA